MGPAAPQKTKDRPVLAGCDSCGRPLCCKTFLKKPLEVNPEILKKPGNRNKSKLIGACGRLKCCLAFE